MRRVTTLLTTIALTLSGLVFSPANASTQNCGGGGTFTITGSEVTAISSDCSGIVSFPEGVASISPLVSDGFMVTELFLPSTFDSRDLSDDFQMWSGLTKVTVSDANPNLSSDSLGVVFNKNKTSLLLYPQGKTDSSYIIPWGVLEIANSALNSAKFTSVQIPGTVTSIGVSAFIGSSLTSVVIPASVTTLRYYAFRGNTSLTTVTFAGDPPGPAGSGGRYVFMDVTATVRYSQVKETSWTTKLSEYDDQYTNLTASGGNVYNFDNNGAIGIEPVPQWKPTGNTNANRWTAPATTATKAGYTFASWNTQLNGTGDSYLPGAVSDNIGDLNLYAQWTAIPTADTPALTGDTPAPTVDNSAAAADLAARTISAKKRYAIKPLAQKVGITIVSSKAKVTFKVAKSSSKVCTKSGSKLKTLKAGNCNVTFTVQEPKPKKGKKPKATTTAKTFVVK
jgi:uncharacterized repeat protein (TIGR02543 family)